MKVSVNWIKQFLDFELPSVDELVEKIGAQLGAVEEVVDIGAKYKDVVVVKVVSCEPHPNADRLKVCTIDDGGITSDVNRDENGYVQVVCGAPNVTAGMTVAWLPPGSTVPESADKDPFVLEARPLRGVVSNGMLASAKELAVGDNHEGILEIDKDARPGDSFAELFKLDDYIIDIENKMFTHRPDCFGALGVAREIAGILHQSFKSPDWYVVNPTFPAKETDLPLEIENELPELVPRFSAVTVSDVDVKPSPVWLQIALSKVGQKPINNIVDLTNFYMLVTGQPLHAYDYDKVKSLSGDSAKIVVRYPRKGEKLALINGKEIEPRSEAIMIATDQKAIGLGGVMGGAETEVDENTKNIILECANFDMYSIRRTSMAHGLFTDAVTRFNKGQSPLQTLAVLAKITGDIQKTANGKVASELIDDKHNEEKWQGESLLVEPKFINDRLGLQLTENEIIQLLTNVEISAHDTDGSVDVVAPFWRTDIEIPEDVVEEVGRLYGYDHLPLELPRRNIRPAQKDKLLETKAAIRAALSKAGANEVLTYSFVHGNLLDKVGQDKNDAFQLSNALSPDLQYYRLSLMPSLLEKVHPNIKAGYDEFALFELGKSHIVSQIDDTGLPREDELTALVVAAADKLKKSSAAYYQAKKYLTNLVGKQLTFKAVPADMQSYDITKPYDMNRAAFVYAGDTFLGIIGEFRTIVTKNLKLPKYCAGFELDTEALKGILAGQNNYVALPRFPSVTQDITLKVPAELPYQELYDVVWGELSKVQSDSTLPRFVPLGMYQAEGDTSHKNVTFRFTIASYEKTMRDEEVAKMLDAAAQAAKQKFGAEHL